MQVKAGFYPSGPCTRMGGMGRDCHIPGSGWQSRPGAAMSWFPGTSGTERGEIANLPPARRRHAAPPPRISCAKPPQREPLFVFRV
jgi:hypothetical protein